MGGLRDAIYVAIVAMKATRCTVRCPLPRGLTPRLNHSRFRTDTADLESRPGKLSAFRLDGSVDTHACKSAADEACWEIEKLYAGVSEGMKGHFGNRRVAVRGR